MWRKAGTVCRGGREPSSPSSPLPLHLKLSTLAADDAFVVTAACDIPQGRALKASLEILLVADT